MSDLLAALVGRVSSQVENLVLFETIDSTHQFALRLIEQMDAEGVEVKPTVVMARRQLGGKGRGQRSWSSPEGGLYLSWIAAGLPSQRVAQLPLLAAAATQEAVERQGIDDVALKWPNDLVLDGAKLGGVLVHARHGDPTWATVGVGINVTRTPEVEEAAPRPPTSLAERLGASVDDGTVVALAESIIASLTAALEDPDPALQRWRSRLLHRPGDHLAVRLASGEELTGTFAGLTEEGFLVLETGAGRRVVSSGDVVEGA